MGLRNKPDIVFAECRVPVKQLNLMVTCKKVRLPSERFQRIQFICRNYIIKLKAAKLSRFLSLISVKFLNISQK